MQFSRIRCAAVIPNPKLADDGIFLASHSDTTLQNKENISEGSILLLFYYYRNNVCNGKLIETNAVSKVVIYLDIFTVSDPVPVAPG